MLNHFCITLHPTDHFKYNLTYFYIFNIITCVYTAKTEELYQFRDTGSLTSPKVFLTVHKELNKNGAGISGVFRAQDLSLVRD